MYKLQNKKGEKKDVKKNKENSSKKKIEIKK